MDPGAGDNFFKRHLKEEKFEHVCLANISKKKTTVDCRRMVGAGQCENDWYEDGTTKVRGKNEEGRIR